MNQIKKIRGCQKTILIKLKGNFKQFFFPKILFNLPLLIKLLSFTHLFRIETFASLLIKCSFDLSLDKYKSAFEGCKKQKMLLPPKVF